MNEYRTIPGFSKYKIDPYGNVISYARYEFGQLLRSSIRKGYKYYRLTCDDGLNKSLSVQRLVALTFIPMIKDKNLVHHIDEDKLNNHVFNLAWLDNNEHELIHGKIVNTERTRRGVKVYNIKEGHRREFINSTEASIFTGISTKEISKSISRRNIKDKTWMFNWI